MAIRGVNANEKQFTDILKVQGINAKGFGMIPKIVMTDLRLSCQAKAIYAYFCSYAGNGSQAFPSVSLILHHLCIGKSTYYKHFTLLKKYGYITVEQTKTRGQFAKNIYTLCTNPSSPIDDISAISPCPKNEYTENKDTGIEDSNINSININNIYNNQSINQDKEQKPIDGGIDKREKYKNLIKKNIEYDYLKKQYPHEDKIDEILDIMTEVVNSNKNTIKINGEDKPLEIVKSVFFKLDSSHIEYIIYSFSQNTKKIVNIRAYMISVLYNALRTKSLYYSNLVAHHSMKGEKNELN